MSRTEIISKSISRLTLINVLENGGNINNAKTTRGIMTGLHYNNYTDLEKNIIENSINNYSEYAENIYIYEGIGDIGVNQIHEVIKNHILFTQKNPVVIVDYLQVLYPNNIKASDKQNIDKAVIELKRISRDYKIPVIAISSFNRANYSIPVTMEAFKESGAIEYSSDVRARRFYIKFVKSINYKI